MSTEFFNSAESAVTYAATAAEILLFVRLAWLGLLRELKVFAIFLAFDAVRTLILLEWDYHSHSYVYIWSISAPIGTFLLFCVTLELLRRLREPFPKEPVNRTVALFGFLAGLTVSVFASILLHPYVIHRPLALLTVIANRSVLSGCILGLLAQGVYLTLGDAPLLSNMRLHRRILLVFMTAAVIASFTAGLKHRELAEWIQFLREFSQFGCFCYWTLALRPMFSDLWNFKGYPTGAQLAEILVDRRRQRLMLGATGPPRKVSTI